MANLELNYGSSDYSIVANTTTGSFGIEGDYLRVTVGSQMLYSGSSNINLNVAGNQDILFGQATASFTTYYDNVNENIYLKPKGAWV